MISKKMAGMIFSHAGRLRLEVECKAVSLYTGWPIKPENVDKLLVEAKNNFSWTDQQSTPVLALTLATHLAPAPNPPAPW